MCSKFGIFYINCQKSSLHSSPFRLVWRAQLFLFVTSLRACNNVRLLSVPCTMFAKVSLPNATSIPQATCAVSGAHKRHLHRSGPVIAECVPALHSRHRATEFAAPNRQVDRPDTDRIQARAMNRFDEAIRKKTASLYCGTAQFGFQFCSTFCV